MSKNKQEINEELAAGLRDYLPNSPDSDNWLLLEGAASFLERDDSDLESVDLATTVQGDIAPNRTVPRGSTEVVESDEYVEYEKLTVNGTLKVFGTVKTRSEEINGSLEVQPDGTYSVEDQFAIDRLEKIGALVDTYHQDGESFEKYRARLHAEFALATCEGTITDVLITTGNILNTNTKNINYSEPSGGENGTIKMDVPGKALDNSSLTDSEVGDILNRLVPASYRVNAFRRGTFTYVTPTDYNNNNMTASKGYDGLDNNGNPKDNGGTYAGLFT